MAQEPDAVGRVRDWLSQLSVRISPALNKRELAGRVSVLAVDLAELFPPDAFTRASMLHVGAQCRFWPNLAELADALRPWWLENRPYRPGLPAPVEPMRPPPTAEERAAIHDLVDSITSELLAQAANREALHAARNPPKPRLAATTSPELLAELRRRANPQPRRSA
jgi:hypothetical protein